jgi:hypothetical protein
MFIRYSYRKGYCYLLLVKSFRNKEGKVRQKKVTNLGRANKSRYQKMQKLAGGWVPMKQADIILEEFEGLQGLAKSKPMFVKF